MENGKGERNEVEGIRRRFELAGYKIVEINESVSYDLAYYIVLKKEYIAGESLGNVLADVGYRLVDWNVDFKSRRLTIWIRRVR